MDENGHMIPLPPPPPCLGMEAAGGIYSKWLPTALVFVLSFLVATAFSEVCTALRKCTGNEVQRRGANPPSSRRRRSRRSGTSPLTRSAPSSQRV
jgi:hypothetical protein